MTIDIKEDLIRDVHAFVHENADINWFEKSIVGMNWRDMLEALNEEECKRLKKLDFFLSIYSPSTPARTGIRGRVDNLLGTIFGLKEKRNRRIRKSASVLLDELANGEDN